MMTAVLNKLIEGREQADNGEDSQAQTAEAQAGEGAQDDEGPEEEVCEEDPQDVS